MARYSMGEMQKRRTVVLKLLFEIDRLEAELQTCADAAREDEIKSSLRLLRRKQKDLSVSKQIRRSAIPLPQSYIKEREETRDAARRVSERDRIRATFLQGGAPGGGRLK